jgi:hypothetical protein
MDIQSAETDFYGEAFLTAHLNKAEQLAAATVM